MLAHFRVQVSHNINLKEYNDNSDHNSQLVEAENSAEAEKLWVIQKKGFEVNELLSEDLIQQDAGTPT